MWLSEDAAVSANLRRIVDNAFGSRHPFKRSSGQLEDLISVFNEIRALPTKEFRMCVDALNEVVDKNRSCVGCCGKGLAFIRRLTEGIDAEMHQASCERYEALVTSRKHYRDSDAQLATLMEQ